MSRATFPGAPSYGGMRTWVEGSQTCGLKPPTYWATMLKAIKLPTNNTKYTLVYTDYYSKTNGVGRDNMYGRCIHDYICKKQTIVYHPMSVGSAKEA